MRTLAHAIDDTDELLLALGRGPDDDQQALRGLLQASLYVDAVDPEVDVELGGEIALASARAPRAFSLTNLPLREATLTEAALRKLFFCSGRWNLFGSTVFRGSNDGSTRTVWAMPMAFSATLSVV